MTSYRALIFEMTSLSHDIISELQYHTPISSLTNLLYFLEKYTISHELDHSVICNTIKVKGQYTVITRSRVNTQSPQGQGSSTQSSQGQNDGAAAPPTVITFMKGNT